MVGGTAGSAIRHDCSRLGLPARWIDSDTPTRICTTVLDAAGGTATELVPNAAELGDAEREAFVAAYAEEAADAAVVVLIGSLPVGTPSALYRDLLAHTPGKVILDARGSELLDALPARPFLVKPNRAELEKTLGRPLRSEEELCDGMREINERGAEWVVITDGGHPLYARSHGHLYRLRPPTAGRIVNPIGCGDCMAAGIAWSIFQGREPIDAVRFGVAAAASKVTQPLPGFVAREQVEALAPSVEIDRL